MRLPSFPGSAWRGGLGWALKRLVCVMRLRPCEGCPLEHSCVYPTVFAARPDEDATKMRLYERVPNPFVLDPVHPARGRVGPEDRVVLDLALIGRACRQIAYLVRALEQAAEAGIGPDRGRLRLVAVTPIREPWAPLALDPTEQGMVAEGTAPEIPPPWPRVELHLRTPLRLQANGRLVGPREFRPACLAMNLVRRVSMLCHHHGDDDLEADFVALKAQAERIRLLGAELAWTERVRRSARQGTLVPMGGIVGRIVLDFEHAPDLWPFLWLGQFLHAGKGTSMGLGAYRLRPFG
ncbi:MAG: CRISPR system precrRNA processing endoribonuclease RAMP protein Cas6 [Geminicoccaceae bacterium]|nr:CRISPR system precrRNA processing endoribonuclease RAMP protein Cas6 [Geminicoccaceae bacterium]